MQHPYWGRAISLLACAILSTPAFAAGQTEGKRAEIRTNWLEGDADSRARFKAIQDKPARALEVQNWINSDALTLASLKGKVVLIDFWGTWCPPCLAQIPRNNQLHEKYKEKGLAIVGVCHTDGAETMGDIVKEKGIKYPVAADIDLKTSRAYLAGEYPQYYLIDRGGNLRICSINEESLEDAVKALLQEP